MSPSELQLTRTAPSPPYPQLRTTLPFPGDSTANHWAVNHTAENHKPLFWSRVATKLSLLIVPQLCPSIVNPGKHTRMPQKLAGRNQKNHELSKLPLIPAASRWVGRSWGRVREAIYTFPSDRIRRASCLELLVCDLPGKRSPRSLEKVARCCVKRDSEVIGVPPRSVSGQSPVSDH